jgi:hypothetical protein
MSSFFRKSILILLSFHTVNIFLHAQTTLLPGDLAIIGFKTGSGTDAGNDAIKLVSLVELSCNTKFIVTDNNWRNTGAWYCNNDEFAVEITVNQRVSAGSVIYIDVDASGGTISTSTGALSKVSIGGDWGTNFGLNSGGDNIFILQGDRAVPNFIFGIRHSGTFASGGDCSTKNNTSLPSALTVGSTALQMSSTSDQWHYNCNIAISTGTKAGLLSSISTPSNWVSTTQTWNSSTCFFSVTDQFPISGSLSVAGAGCGCLSGCNLTTLGGVNCSPAVAGDCTSGYQTMTRNISVPSGCTYTVYATFRPWPGCSSSGGDGGATGDQLKVDVQGGTKPVQTGSSNAFLNDSYSLTGPGVITVSGRSNRADEIIVYKLIASESGIPCSICPIPLPIEFSEFEVSNEGKVAVLNWQTETEVNSSYFSVERSLNGIDWEHFSLLPAAGHSSDPVSYRVYDTSPFDGLSYYRLTQFDIDGESRILGVRSFISSSERKLVKCLNLLGQEISNNSTGYLILYYDNGDVVREFH